MMAAANGVEGGIAQLSAQLTQAIAVVELQRATVEESILRLFAEAQQLNQVSDALCQAASTQGTVLVHLQQLLQNANAPAGMVQALAPAAQGIAAAHQVLAAPATPPQPAVREWEVGQPNGPNQGDTVWHDGQQCSVQYINSKGLLDLRNQAHACNCTPPAGRRLARPRNETAPRTRTPQPPDVALTSPHPL